MDKGLELLSHPEEPVQTVLASVLPLIGSSTECGSLDPIEEHRCTGRPPLRSRRFGRPRWTA